MGAMITHSDVARSLWIQKGYVRRESEATTMGNAVQQQEIEHVRTSSNGPENLEGGSERRRPLGVKSTESRSPISWRAAGS